jgi:hypothetical protein
MKKILILLFFITTFSFGQSSYYSPITEKQYNRIISGTEFYSGQVQLKDDNWYKGWIARFPDSNTLRFRALEDSTYTYTLTNKDVKSFVYILEDSFPKFVFKELPKGHYVFPLRDEKVIALEQIILGKLNLYIYKSVRDVNYLNAFLQTKHEYQMILDFFIEKNGELFFVTDFEQDLKYLINDNEKLYEQYKKTKKERQFWEYTEYINIIIQYNEQ